MNALGSILAVVVLMAAWVTVQRLWVNAVGADAGADALEGRTDCRSCTWRQTL